MTGDFCSLKCTGLHNHPPVIVTCIQCGKPFKKKPSQIKKFPCHFCGHPCATRHQNAHKTTGTRVSRLERWLQEQLPALYPHLDFHFNRKDAIDGELDIYIPVLKLAFELNGIFHYEPIYGAEKLANVRNNDSRKFQACIERGIELCLVDISSMKHFKPKGAQKYLEIVKGVVDSRCARS